MVGVVGSALYPYETQISWPRPICHAAAAPEVKTPYRDLADVEIRVDFLGIYHSWLVVWNIFIFPYIGNNHPN